MADAIRCSLASKPPNNYLLQFTPSKPCFIIPSLSFQNSIHTKTRKKIRHLLHFTCLSAPNFTDFDVVSTHEHSDGSFVFRFGDLSEVVRNDQMEEASLEVDGKGTEEEDESGVVNIVESDHRREVMAKNMEGEEKSEDSIEAVGDTNPVVENQYRSVPEVMVKNMEGEEKSEDPVEAVDDTNPVVGNRSRSVPEIENSSGETSSSSSIGVQMHVSPSSLEICDSSEITDQVDDVLLTRGSIELNHSVGFDDDDFVHSERSIEQNRSSESVTQVENVVFGEQCLVENDGYESQVAPSPCPLSGPEDDGTSAETVEGPLSGKNKELISLELNQVVEVTRDNDHDKEPLVNNDVDQREASLSSSLSKQGSGQKDEFSAEIIEPLTGRNQELIPAQLDSVIEVPVDGDGKNASQENIDDGKKTSQENIELAHASNNADAQNEEAGSENTSVGDSNNSEIVEMVSMSSPLETEPALDKEKNGKNVEVGTQNDIMGGISESEVIGEFSLSPPLLAEPALGEAGDVKSEEIKSLDDVQGDSYERVVIGELPVSLPFGVEPVLNKGGATTRELRSHIDITGSSSESEGIGTLPLSLPSEAEPVLDEGGVKVVEVGTQTDLMRVGGETEVIGSSPPSLPLEAEPFLDKGGAATREVRSHITISGSNSEGEGIGTLPLSLPFDAQPVLDEGGDEVVEVGTQNDLMMAGGKNLVIGSSPPSPPLEAEPVLDKGGSTTREVGSHIDRTGSSSESEGIGTLPLSLPSEAESYLVEGGVKIVEVGRNDIMRVGSETEVIGMSLLSPPLEAEPFFGEEGDAKKVEGGTEHEIEGGSSESKIISALPMHPPLEVQPIPNNEAEPELTETFDESFRSGTAITINTFSKAIEVEVNNESAGTDESVVSADGDKTGSKSITTDLPSEKIFLEKLFLSFGAASLPHPEKALAGGEDACFTCQNWLGVADGVSRWSLEGVDHGKYAHELMEIARELVSSCCDTTIPSPKEVLYLAVDRAHYPGCSTVLISHFDGQNLHVANIGDSGIIIIRNDAVCQRSSPMYHEYNFPVLVQREDDSSKLVEQYTFSLNEGDVVVSATDGLFDNLYEEDIISIVSKSLEANINPKEIAEILAMSAQEVGASTCTRSPFSDEAQAAGYIGCTGGKLDDVVVVVSIVKKRLDCPPA